MKEKLYSLLEFKKQLKEYNRERLNLMLEDNHYTPDSFLKWLEEREVR